MKQILWNKKVNTYYIKISDKKNFFINNIYKNYRKR